MYRFVRRTVFVVAVLSLCSIGILGQERNTKGGQLNCGEDNWYNDRLVSNCEVREETIAATGSVAVDGKQNGGIAVKGWDQNQVLVRARVQAAAPTREEADAMAKQIRIDTGGGKISASGPERDKNYQWDVSYEVFVPKRSDLSLNTHNGGISIANVNGKIDFDALNGGAVLRYVGGTVHGSTTTGGLMVELGGDHWDGETLDVKTANGGVVMAVPENYSAHLETGTVNGGLTVDFPVTVQGKITRELAVNLGSGGATVRAMTTNGGVRIRRTGSN